MKHTFRCAVSFIFLLSLTSARFLHTKPGDNMLTLDESINISGSEHSLVDLDSFINEGMECGSGDEECLKRRVLAVADAHLDYIYTQHHKP
ncbi:hypothetical protein M8C21_014211 [Ambrosia artemisiifolia]|uniref:Phytosulfokine n=1 Tax=Ambrosia artemisiifolia TaxID=4212 RepID=A0AAD5GMQ4_AMBAR|nr:hypothetical protein M8C21_014211 [Ambrosia artemisiifolia]